MANGLRITDYVSRITYYDRPRIEEAKP